MNKYRFKGVAFLLIVFIFTNFLGIGITGNDRVKAGFWDEHKGGIMTVVKGLLMLWIMNLISQNTGSDDNEDILTSTIKKGLNLEVTDESTQEQSTLPENINKEPSPSYDNTEIASQVRIYDSNDIEITAQEKELVDMVNKERQKQGIQPLVIDNMLVKIAREKARDIIENDYFGHQSPTYGSPFAMMKENEINYALAGENLAGAATVEKAFMELMKSPEHKKNILEVRYDKIGVGVVKGGPYGLIVVQEFVDSPEFDR